MWCGYSCESCRSVLVFPCQQTTNKNNMQTPLRLMTNTPLRHFYAHTETSDAPLTYHIGGRFQCCFIPSHRAAVSVVSHSKQMLGDLPLFKSRHRYWNSNPPWHSIACLTFSVTFSGSRVNPTCTGLNRSLDFSVRRAFYSWPVGVHLAEHHSKVGPAISSCPRIGGGVI